MLFLTSNSPLGFSFDPVAAIKKLSATAAGNHSDSLQKLQVALVALASATHNDAIKPANVTGTLTNSLPDDGTMTAVVSVIGLISAHLPALAGAALTIGLGLGASSDKAKQAVLDYADELTTAVKAATVAAPFYNSKETTDSNTGNQTQKDESILTKIFPMTDTWYTSWWGLASIAIATIGTVSFLFPKK